jgi:iodotyrosine deiodinase
MPATEHRPYTEYVRVAESEMSARSEALLASLRTRRTVRHFSEDPVDPDVVENCIRIAATAPSGANQQPWTFVVVNDPAKRRELREAAEAEERAFYSGRAPQEWLSAVQPFGTDDQKPFLESAPVLIAIFARSWLPATDGGKQKTYYATESVGIATGFLISALHQCGLASLTHTPSPMRFLNRILDRPDNERPYLLLVAGIPASDCHVPVITKRTDDDVIVHV